jgi:hypothetical protein
MPHRRPRRYEQIREYLYSLGSFPHYIKTRQHPALASPTLFLSIIKFVKASTMDMSTTLPSQKSKQGLMFSRFQDLPAELRLKIWGMAMRAHVRVITTRVYFFSGYIYSNNFEEDEEARQAVFRRRKKLFEFVDDPLEDILKTRTSQELEDDGVYVQLQATSNLASESCHESRQEWQRWCISHKNQPIRHLFNTYDGSPAYDVTTNVYVAPHDIILLEAGNVEIRETFSAIAPFLAKTQRLAIAYEYTDGILTNFFPSGLKLLILVWGKNPNRSRTHSLKHLKHHTTTNSGFDRPGSEDIDSMTLLSKYWGSIVGSNVRRCLATRKLVKGTDYSRLSVVFT